MLHVIKVHETRSHSHSSGNEERKVTRKQKAEGKATTEAEAEHSPKKAKIEDDDDDNEHENGGKSTEDIKEKFDKFCKATSEHLSIPQMREILEANGEDASGADDAVVPRWSFTHFSYAVINY